MVYANAAQERAHERANQSIAKLAPHSASLANDFDVGSLFGYSSQNLLYTGAGLANRATFERYKYWTYTALTCITTRCAAQPWQAGNWIGASSNADLIRRRGNATKSWNQKNCKDRFRRKLAIGREFEQLPNYVKSIGEGDVELIDRHESLDLLSQPNSMQTHSEFIDVTIANLQLAGAAYIIGGETEESGLELWAIPYTWLIPQHDKGLFSEYLFVPPGLGVIGKPIDGSLVGRIYYPDPNDLRREVSPVVANEYAARTDEKIQKSQFEYFDQGIWPNVMIEVGNMVDADGKATNVKPVLESEDRARLIRTVRHVWKTTTANGDPGIIDGLIAGVHKMSQSAQEMDFQQSSELVKDRIFQAFKVNPYIAGQITGVNKAQAVVAERIFARQVVNPALSKIGEAITKYIGHWWDRPERLVLWLKPVEVADEDTELRKWDNARKNGDVSRNEYRTKVLGEPPVKDDEMADQHFSKLIDNPQTMAQCFNVVKSVNAKEISEGQGRALIRTFLGCSDEYAKSLIDKPIDPPEPPAPALPEPPQGDGGDENGDGVEPGDSGDNGDDASRGESGDDKKGPWAFKAQESAAFEGSHVKQNERLNRKASKSIADFLNGQVERFADAVKNSSPAAAVESFDLTAETEALQKFMVPILTNAMRVGAETERRVFEAKARGLRGKSTATDIAEAFDINVDDIATELPAWMLAQARIVLAETMKQPYWQEITAKTLADFETVLNEGLVEGWSTRRIASTIMNEMGAEYSRVRATRIARTEIGSMVNAGHRAQVDQLATEFPELELRAEWMSVFSRFTRVSHAGLSGALADADGMFSLGGVRVSYPAHHSLPAKERINCLCTVTTGTAMKD